MAQVAVLPVLVGLAVDYAIQFQARVQEAAESSGERPRAEAIRAAAARGPGRVLGVGLALAALGWGLDTQTRVETDITKLVPQSLGSLQNLGALERATGVGGEIDLMVSGNGVVSPATIEWMSAYQSS